MIKAEDFKWLDRVYHLFHLGSYLCLSVALTDCFLPLIGCLMMFCVISTFHWLNDVTVARQQLWRDVTKFEQNVHKFDDFTQISMDLKAGNYCTINRIPCKCLLILSLSGLTRKRGMARQSLAIHTRFLVAPDKLHIKRHEHAIFYYQGRDSLSLQTLVGIFLSMHCSTPVLKVSHKSSTVEDAGELVISLSGELVNVIKDVIPVCLGEDVYFCGFWLMC